MRPAAGVARTAARAAQTAKGALENGGEEGPESRQAGGEDSEAEFQHVPDVEPVFEALVGHVGEFDLQAGFQDSGDAGEEAEREDDDQGRFGAFVDLELEDDGDWKDGEEDVGRDVDDRVEQADEAVGPEGETARVGLHPLGDVPASGNRCALEH